jgi:hypothetical protein
MSRGIAPGKRSDISPKIAASGDGIFPERTTAISLTYLEIERFEPHPETIDDHSTR